MRKKVLSIVLGITIVAAMALGGCGGGDGSGSSSGSTAQIVSGTASSGAAFSGSVFLKDARGKQLTTNTATGGFTFDVTSLTAPFILKAGTLYSIATGTGTTNINPFTNIIAKSAAGSSTNLDTVFANVSSNRSKLTGISSNLTQAISNFNAAMNQKDSTGMSIYTKYGLTSPPDFLHGTITIDKDVDKLFADIIVSMSGTAVTVTNKSGATLLSGSYSVSGSTVSFNFTPNYTNIKGLSGSTTATSTTPTTTISTTTTTTSQPFPFGTWVGPHGASFTVTKVRKDIGQNYYGGSITFPAFGTVTFTGNLDPFATSHIVLGSYFEVLAVGGSGTSATFFTFQSYQADNMTTQTLKQITGTLIVTSTQGYAYNESATFVKQ